MQSNPDQISLFADPLLLPIDYVLATAHYLGPSARGTIFYRDEFGLMVFAPPTSRHLPRHWLELTRWCLVGERNGGSQQWRRARTWLRATYPNVSTIVSYSDPAYGHTGALYRACNWLWAPTWLTLRVPPSQGGSWDGVTPQSVKDRWIAVLAPDVGRAEVLAIQDDAVRARMPWAEYREPEIRGERIRGGGGDYARYRALRQGMIS